MTKKTPHPNSHAAKLTLAQAVLRDLREDNAALQERCTQMNLDIEELAKANHGLRGDVFSLRDQLTGMTSAAQAHEAQAAENRQRYESEQKVARQCLREREEAQKALSDARENIDRLKRQLLEAELETARLRGYIQRVVEDDEARETRHETQHTEVHARRSNPPAATDTYRAFNDGSRGRHWTGL